MIKVRWPIFFSIQLMIIPPFEDNLGDWQTVAIRLSNKIKQ